METTAAHREYSEEKVLFLALKLSNSKWKLGSTGGVGSKARERTIAASDLEALHEEVSRAKRRFGLESSARVVSCYEAGGACPLPVAGAPPQPFGRERVFDTE